MRARRSARSCRISNSALHASLVPGAPRLDALPQPDFLLGQFLVELLLAQRLVGQPLFLLPQERGVVARPGREASAIELHDPRGQALEEHAVVRDEHHGALIVEQERLEPGHRLDVQVVGGLVEQQQVRLAHQRAGQEHAPPPAAGQRVGRRVGRQVEAGEHLLDHRLALPGVLVVRAQGSQTFGHHVAHAARIVQRHVLGEPADREARADARRCPHRARVLR